MYGKLTCSSALLAALLLLPGAARGAHDSAATASFWAFTKDGSHFLIYVEDENRGPTLAVKKVGKLRSLHEVLTDGRPPQLFLKSPPLSQYRFVDAGVKGPEAPDGKVKIVGAQSGASYEFYLKYGKIMVDLFKLPLDTDPTGQHVATGSLKEVVWNSAGTACVIVFNQANEAHYGVNVDQVISFVTAPYYKKIAAAARKAKK